MNGIRYLDYEGLEEFKKKNDGVYLKQSDLKKNPFDYIKQISDYLFETQYSTTNIDYDFANTYFSNPHSDIDVGRCTGIYKDGRVLRQLDWYYDDNCEFIIRRPADPERGIHASIGVVTGTKTLTKDFVESREYSEKYKLLPFLTVDGINDVGLFIQSNVVPKNGISYNINPASSSKCCVVMFNRYVLDHCVTLNDVKEALETVNIYSFEGIEYGSHFLVAKGSEWMIIELTANSFNIVNSSTMPYGIMTNFRTTGVTFTGDNINWESVEDYGIGVERFDLATKAFTEDLTFDRLRDKLKYTNTYNLTIDPLWRTEFAGEADPTVAGRKLTVMDAKNTPQKYENILIEQNQKFNERTRKDGKGTWQTTHSAIYDLNSKSFNMTIQERLDKSYNFSLNEELVAGNNIVINGNTISAKDTTYTASTGIDIDTQNNISVKYDNNTIKVDTDGKLKAETNTYLPFPPDFITDGTLEEVVNSMMDSSGAKQGMAYLGGIEGECTPFGFGNVECKVEFMLDGLCVLTVNSSNTEPYQWMYNSYSGDYIWKKYTDVIPNPEVTTTEVLSKVSIDGQVYNIGGQVTKDPITVTSSVGSIVLGEVIPAGTSLEDIIKRMLTI